MGGARDLAKGAAQRVNARWRRLPLQQAVMLEAFEGRNTSGDPGMLAEYLLEHTDLPLIWSARNPGAKNPRVQWVRYRSASYFKALATSAYLINNVTFPPLFDKRDDQIYLNTWHGTPLKKMGRDVDEPYSHIANTVANFTAADLLLSSGEYMTATMYAGAYAVSTDSVVELGTPRVDRQFGSSPELVLYAPTWQEASRTEAADDTDELAARMAAIAEVVERPVLRVHSKLASRAAADRRLRPYLMDGDINELLGRTRVLITDFSSVAFDYLATGSQVLFFTPTPYQRGVYLSDEELPGPRTESLDTLCSWLLDPPAVEMGAARQRFCPHEDGKATHRVVQRLVG